MKKIRRWIPVLAVLVMAGAVPWGGAQNPGSAAPGTKQEKAAPEPERVTVEIVNRIPPVDRGNLQEYWNGVEQRTKDQWLPIVPAVAKPPASTPGEVKIVCWIHTDGRVTGMVLEGRSGNTALDRAAWAAITGSAPYDAFPYGISMNQVRVRFTFTYNGGNVDNPANGKGGPVSAKPRPIHSV